MSSRARILDRLHHVRNGVGDAAHVKEAAVPANRIPADRESLINRFSICATESGCLVTLIRSAAELEAATVTLTSTRAALAFDRRETNTVVRAHAALAETGSVFLHSRAVPSQSLFLCEHLVIQLSAEDILRYPEDYWHRTANPLPRAVHMITGPSRTADVEQTLQIGAHGPKQVTILLCDW